MINDEFEKLTKKQEFDLKLKCINEYYNDLSKDFESAFLDTNYSSAYIMRNTIVRLIQEIRELKIELLLKE